MLEPLAGTVFWEAAQTAFRIGGNAPSVYLGRLEKNAGIAPERMEAILRSHLIDPRALRANDFEAFFRAREEALLDRIQAAIGKPIARGTVPDVPVDDDDYEPEPTPEEPAMEPAAR